MLGECDSGDGFEDRGGAVAGRRRGAGRDRTRVEGPGRAGGNDMGDVGGSDSTDDDVRDISCCEGSSSWEKPSCEYDNGSVIVSCEAVSS